MRLVYLASPLTDKSQKIMDFRFAEITKIAGLLKKKYPNTVCFLPITQSYMMKKYVPSLGTAFKSWAKDDLFIIGLKADEIWICTMVGWKQSIGVQAEIEHAKALNKKIKYVDPVTLKLTKNPPEY